MNFFYITTEATVPTGMYYSKTLNMLKQAGMKVVGEDS